VILLSALVLCRQAEAQDKPDQTVQGLYMACKETNMDQFDRGRCLGFISGIGDVMAVIGSGRHDLQLGLCGPSPTPTYGAMIQAFMNWAEKHPEQWNIAQEAGVVIALRETWPCVGKAN
jgi:hypothetical protein